MSFSRILVPVDLSERSLHALEVAAAVLHREGGGRCDVLHVSVRPHRLSLDEAETPDIERARQALGNLVTRVDIGSAEIEPIVVDSPNIVATILRTAAERSSDLIVMTTRRRTRPAAWLLPSMTTQVLATGQAPVLVLFDPRPRIGLIEAWRDPRVRARGDVRFN